MTTVTSANEAVALLRTEAYDMALLDMTAATPDSRDVICALRAARNDIPILAITGEAHDTAAALALGADDAIPVPFAPAELQARIACVLRRRLRIDRPSLTVGNFALCNARHDAFVADIPVRLTGREYALLEYLAARKGRAVGKDVLFLHLYPNRNETDTKIIDVFICKIRRKLQRAGGGSLIGTIWGHGYVINDQPAAGTPPVTDEGRELVA